MNKPALLLTLLLAPGVSMYLPAGEYPERPELPETISPTRMTCLGGKAYKQAGTGFKATGASCQVDGFKRRFR